MNKSILNHNITTLLNEMFGVGVGIGGTASKINNLLNMNYNSFNDTLYIETEDKYIVIECKGGVIPLLTEFNKTADQKRFNGSGENKHH